MPLTSTFSRSSSPLSPKTETTIAAAAAAAAATHLAAMNVNSQGAAVPTHAPAPAHVPQPNPRRARAPSCARACAQSPAHVLAPATHLQHHPRGDLMCRSRASCDRGPRGGTAHRGHDAWRARRVAPEDRVATLGSAPPALPPPALPPPALHPPALPDGFPCRAGAASLHRCGRALARGSRRGCTDGARTVRPARDCPYCAAAVRRPSAARRRASDARARGGRAALAAWQRLVGRGRDQRHLASGEAGRQSHHAPSPRGILPSDRSSRTTN